MTPILSVHHLHTRFGEQVIHQDLSFDIHREEILGIVGGSGSGKSVLMRFLIGLEPPQQGEIRYMTDPPYPAQQVGVLFQSGALISSLTVFENIMIPLLEVCELSEQLAYEIAQFKVHLVGLPLEAGHKYPSQLSGGMIKRAALARALAMDPEILFLDEPTSGLDPIGAAGFDQLLHELQKKLKMTVVMITHDLDSLVEVCDRVAVLVDQKIIVGPLQEIQKMPHPWIQNYFHGARGQRFFDHSVETSGD